MTRVADDLPRLRAAWSEFRDLVQEPGQDVPYHLRGLLKTLEEYRQDRPREEIVLLDHGCGGGFTLIYLAALGYTNVHGVDIGTSPCERWNLLVNEVWGVKGKRFHVYSKTTLPLSDDSVDVVFSQEVLEHVSPDVFDAYYAEEQRVLVPGGLAVHGVPHRLVPYDSHTRTWFLHWFLPREMWLRALSILGRDVETARAAIFLRWPWEHTRMARRHFGEVRDRTIDRLVDLQQFEYYDGPLRLRLMIARLVRMPVLGPVFGAILSRFVMIDTVSRNCR